MRFVRILPFLIFLFLTSCNVTTNEKLRVHPIYDVKAFESGDYFAIPFPDFHRVSEGKVDFRDFPGVNSNEMFRRVARQLEENFTGFGLNSAIFVPFSGEVSEESLSFSVTDSVNGGSPVYLVDIDDNSPQRGKRIPIMVRFYKGDSKYLPSNTLIVIPVPGFPLRENTWYALVIKDGLLDKDGNRVVPPEDFEEEYNRGIYPFNLVRKITGNEKIILAVPFRTGVASEGLKKIYQYVQGIDVKFTVDPDLYYAYWNYDPRPEIEGKFLSPQFQKGDPPYLKEGEGYFVFDSEGNPVPQRWEWVRFSILLPDSPPPENGYPVVIYAHGTGGDYQTYIRSWVGYYLTSMGYAVVGFDQPLHGARNPRHGGEELYTFNFINPVAMRDNIRQGAVDLFVLRKMVEKFYLSPASSPTGWKIFFDMERAGFFGHSQGALTGALYLAIEDFPFRGAVLSGSSGDLILAFLYKVSPVNIPDLFKIFLTEYDNYTLFNPILSLFQIMADPADPINFGKDIIYHHGRKSPMNLYISEGLEDEETPPPLIEAFGSTTGVVPVEPVYKMPIQFNLKKVTPLTRPVEGNLTIDTDSGEKRVTAVFIQYPGYGHFACFESEDAIDDWTQFFRSLLDSRVAEIK